jgi:hypothetical protein
MKKRYRNNYVRLLVLGSLSISLMLSIISSIESKNQVLQKNQDSNSDSTPQRAVSNQDVKIQSKDDADNVERYTIVAKVLSNHCRLSSDGNEVVTDYVVWITEVREGALLSGNKIKVTIRGGVVLLKADGTEVRQGNPLPGKTKKAKVEIPNSATPDTKIAVPLNGVASTKFTPFNPGELMQNEKSYVLTLTKNANEKTYRLFGLPTLTNN